ncbi:pleiotropic drug resistance ABC transporter [Mycena olivaceomarginata]|nr:pleiotropic drug resistance ABC transporter [Mycena olivaceomarginata]
MADLPKGAVDTSTHSSRSSPTPPKASNVGRSSVDADFFDPAGMQGLQRTVTGISERFSTKQPNARPDSDATLGDGPFDLEKTIKFVQRKLEEANVDRRELGVVFQDLKVVGLGASASYQPTLGATLNPLSILEQIRTLRHPPLRNILEGFSGVVRPGEMLLVLGRPGSGCSTFLKTLANQTDEYHAVSGDIHYDAFSPRRHPRALPRFASPPGSVQPHAKARFQHTRDEYVENAVEILCTIFGLRHVRKTQVGDNAIRGVSGGEKKRVSIAEALAMRMRMGAWDNSTRGLDASTALEFGRALRIATDFARLTTIVAVISEGRMVYFGPADQAREYFMGLGYVPQAERQTTPDFIVSVTDAAGRIVRPGLTPAEEQARPRTSAELAQRFLESPIMARNVDDINAYKMECAPGSSEKIEKYKRSAEAEHAKGARRSSPYTESIPMQARAVMLRRVQILMGSMGPTVVLIASFVFQGVITGSVYVNSPESTSAFFSRGGVIALLFSALSSMAEITSLFAQRPIILRHNKAALYHPFIEAVALTLVDIPITFFTTAVFGIVMYFIVGLQRTASQFFIFYLFLFTMSLAMKAFFRAIAAAFKTPAPAQIGALRWITYINPLRYGFEAVIANEFHTLKGSCASLVPQGPGYENVSLTNQVCATVGSVAGQSFVDGNSFIAVAYGYSYRHEWMNFGILVAFGIGFLTLLLIFTEFNTSSSTDNPVMLFKRGSKNAALVEAGADAEKAGAGGAGGALAAADQAEVDDALAAAPAMTDIFSWQNVNYVVPLTALMGESGAGKTTLLNVLAERTTIGVVQGDIFVNGHAPPRDFRSQTGYVQQMDTHPASVPMEEKVAYVEKCLKMCGLEAVADASVGTLGVEHRKRTTIGVELAAKPKLLLFLDEPTSGLDSQSAWAIMLFLKQLAANGQAILCTIHQPSAELFQNFDRLLLLRKGGQVVYFGDIGPNSSTLIHHFESNGSRPCDPSENPAEFMLDVIGAGATASSAQDWEAGAVKATFTSDFAASWMAQAKTLLRRDFHFRWRDPTYLLAKLVLNIASGLLIGFTFYQAKTTQQGTQNQLFAIFMSTILCAPLSNQLQVPFLDMRKIYEIREGPTKVLQLDRPCYLGVFIGTSLEHPGVIIVLPLLMLGVVFPLWYTSFAQTIAAMAPSAEIAAVVFTFFFRLSRLSIQSAWMVAMDVSRVAIHVLDRGAFWVKHLESTTLPAAAVELLKVDPPSGQTCGAYFAQYISFAGGYLTNSDATSACEFCSTATTDQLLGPSFNIVYSRHWRDTGLMLVYIGFNIMALYALTYFFRIRTTSIFAVFKRRNASA